MQRHYIQDQTSLNQLCEHYQNAKVLVVDTEFVRTRTLYPRLGLLQINDGQQLALIDPIEISDLTPFWQLLENDQIKKVIHACSEDLEVFLTAGNCRPKNLIDSQVMMTFLGHGLSLGYAATVKHYLDIELDKSESRTDWTKRPLSEKQIRYAQADVDYLYQLYPKLLEEVEHKGWLQACEQETELMVERKFTEINEDELYRNIKMAWKLNPKQLNNLKHLARWRYQKAKTKDQPLSFIVKDHSLFYVAQYSPKNTGAMAAIEGVENLDIRYQGKAMLAVLREAQQESPELYPQKITRLDEYPGYKQIFKKVKNFVAQTAEQHALSPENLASKKQINQFLTHYFKLNGAGDNAEQVDILRPWRNTILGTSLTVFADNGFSE
ncbi:ribonuclease D [Thalassotalea sp. M1531]|uniref:Ribonuclease D n=1 Tax=Thalassotalea algicola TaxID=2716224 RepID=A0A7Y0LFB4_9GAMM|nr:ribonuclease D [Thalassotalea algicola]NMP33478.1 ribonuclease D [Thalassotalea algicola]